LGTARRDLSVYELEATAVIFLVSLKTRKVISSEHHADEFPARLVSIFVEQFFVCQKTTCLRIKPKKPMRGQVLPEKYPAVGDFPAAPRVFHIYFHLGEGAASLVGRRTKSASATHKVAAGIFIFRVTRSVER
jgi:hypothetical protein